MSLICLIIRLQWLVFPQILNLEIWWGYFVSKVEAHYKVFETFLWYAKVLFPFFTDFCVRAENIPPHNHFSWLKPMPLCVSFYFSNTGNFLMRKLPLKCHSFSVVFLSLKKLRSSAMTHNIHINYLNMMWVLPFFLQHHIFTKR